MKKLKRMKPEDLPEGVIANLGEDPRGRCYLFEHNIFGPIGRMIIIEVEGDKSSLNYELFMGDDEIGSLPYIIRQDFLEEIIHSIGKYFY
ncbi:MAG: hypothetical protein KA446_05635 [Leptotrichiaceae bacterium]|nr:hypothetical protein [Leptotrichiaceae bacterium]